MGGGDLNQKKSWHPNTFKNQERVWKAEQVEAAEKRKLAELQAEISAERDREDLRRVGQASGLIAENGNKLEWMYRGAKDNLNREDYLLGRAVDKSYEQFAEEERAADQPNHLGVSVPKNHVEHECVPFSIRAYKDADPTSVQVDMARKIAEDPLMMIKQREMESRKKLLENPMKLKELKELLQSERSGKSKRESKKSKKSKKEKKSRKKNKKKRSRSKSTNSDSSESDVDDALLAMLSKQRGEDDDNVNMEDLNFDQMVNLKYDTLNKELDKMIKSSSSEDDEGRRNKRRDANGQGGDKRRNRNESNRPQRSYSRERGTTRRAASPGQSRSRARSPLEHGRNVDVRIDRRERGSSRDRRARGERSRSRDKVHKRDNQDSNARKTKHSKPRHRSRTPPRGEQEARKLSPRGSCSRNLDEDSRQASKQHQFDSDEEELYKKSAAGRNYGLVTASGESITLKNDGKSYVDRRATQSKKSSKSESTWKKGPITIRPKLTEEEKEERLRQMMKNAEWRDKERESYVRKYHEDGRREEDRQREEDFDRNFIHKELHKSAENETVESRLKSNRNNIQRSSGVMNTNFARR